MQQKELLKWEISRLTTRRESYRAQSRPETPSDQSFPYLLRSISEDSLRASKTCVFDPSRASVTRRAPGRANFPANYSLRRLLTNTHWRYRKSPPVAIVIPVKPVVTCRESQFSDFTPFTGPMSRKNGEIPTYTHINQRDPAPAEPRWNGNRMKRFTSFHNSIGSAERQR